MKQQSFAARVAFTAFLSVVLVLSACDRKPGANSGGSRAPDKEVTVYVSTDRVFSEPILKAYEAEDRHQGQRRLRHGRNKKHRPRQQAARGEEPPAGRCLLVERAGTHACA